MHFIITRFILFDGDGALKAFCDVAVGGLLLIKGVRVIEGRKGLFISMPRQQGKDGAWHDSVVPLSKEMRMELSCLVLETFERHRASTTIGDRRGGCA